MIEQKPRWLYYQHTKIAAAKRSRRMGLVHIELQVVVLTRARKVRAVMHLIQETLQPGLTIDLFKASYVRHAAPSESPCGIRVSTEQDMSPSSPSGLLICSLGISDFMLYSCTDHQDLPKTVEQSTQRTWIPLQKPVAFR